MKPAREIFLFGTTSRPSSLAIRQWMVTAEKKSETFRDFRVRTAHLGIRIRNDSSIFSLCPDQENDFSVTDVVLGETDSSFWKKDSKLWALMFIGLLTQISCVMVIYFPCLKKRLIWLHQSWCWSIFMTLILWSRKYLKCFDEAASSWA